MSSWVRSAPRGALLSGTLFFMSEMLQPRSRPPDPVLHVQPKPGGGESRPRLLLVKPDCPFNIPFDGLLGHEKSLRAEMVAQEVEATLDPPDEGLVRVFL